MSPFLLFMQRLWRHRLILVLLFFVATVGFFDRYSIFNFVQLLQKNAELRAEIEHYKQQYHADSTTLHQIAKSPEAVEKVARVNLLMKTANEDIYIVVEE